jgi:uncharacterized protein YjbI with pentapeptide repeats
MTRDETIALWQRCEEAREAGQTEHRANEAARAIWNAWAWKVKSERQNLKKNNKWKLTSRRFSETRAQWRQRQSTEVQEWLDLARVDFSRSIFVSEENHQVLNIKRGFKAVLHQKGNRVNFDGFCFPGEADFTETIFLSDVNFANVHFEFVAWFRATTFEEGVFFHNPLFSDCAWFRGSSFSRYADFEGASFEKEADFSAIIARRAFRLIGTIFAVVPNFSQANISEAPDFDEVDFPLPGFWAKGESASIPSYRALRRLAVQGHDHEHESRAFKGEVRSKRGAVDKPWHAAFWFGVIYDALSDFGRSMMRPFCIWLLSIAAFTTAYLAHANKLTDWRRSCADGTDYWLKALYLSTKSAFPVVGTLRADEARSISACLYGWPSNQEQTFPATSAFIQMGQGLWSAVLIFLFLLAVRNQFKIK